MVKSLFKVLPGSFYRFFIVGVSAFLIDYSLLNLFYFVFGIQKQLRVIRLTEKVELNYSLASILAILITAFIAYFLNKYWSFQDNSDNVSAQIGKYFAVTGFNSVVNVSLFGLLYYEVLGTDNFINAFATLAVAKFFATATQTITSYFAYKYFVFNNETEVISEATAP